MVAVMDDGDGDADTVTSIGVMPAGGAAGDSSP